MNARRLDRTWKAFRLATGRGSSGGKLSVFEQSPFLSFKGERIDYHRDRMSEVLKNDRTESLRITTMRVRYATGEKLNETMEIEDDRSERYKIVDMSEVNVDGISRRLVGRRRFMDVLLRQEG